MEEWQIRQKIYHMVFKDTDMGDDLSKETIIEEFDPQTIIQRALEYPVKQTKELYYPGKSYAVACIFATLLAEHFGKDVYHYLRNPGLLYENDPYFKCYDNSQEIYDGILKEIDLLCLIDSEQVSENCLRTIDYFYKEFLLHETTKHLAPNHS
jgi:hypothetical protein